MAGVRDDDLRGAGPWRLGIVNATKEDRMPRAEDGRVLGFREGDNVDLDATGVPRRRRGQERFYEAQLAHSLWTDDSFPFGLFVDDGQLHAVDGAGGVEALGIEVGAAPLSYALIGDRVYYTNRTRCGLIDMALQRHEWHPETPDGQPALALASDVSLTPGLYQVAVTFIDALGRESGTSQAAAIDVPEGRGILVTGIPQPAVATRVVVFVTDPNDQVLRQHSVLPAGVTSLVIGTEAQGRKLETQFLKPLPAGQGVGLYNGRQFVASGRTLRWSPPLRYGLTDPVRNVLRFADDIDLFAPTATGAASGVFVAAGKRTYFFTGADPSQWVLNIRKSTGAIPGSLCRVPGNALFPDGDTEDVPVWISSDGQVCVGRQAGVIQSLKQGLTVVDGAERAATLFREGDGLQQYVAALRGARPQGLAVRDHAAAHVIYDGR